MASGGEICESIRDLRYDDFLTQIECAPDLSAQTEEGEYPLMVAIDVARPLGGDTRFFHRLMEYELELHKYTRPPLHFAASRGNSDVVRALISKGANPLAEDCDGDLAYQWILEGTPNAEKMRAMLEPRPLS